MVRYNGYQERIYMFFSFWPHFFVPGKNTAADS